MLSMTKKLNYLILPDKSLIIEYYNGQFHVDELIEFKIKVSNDKDYNPNFNIIHDFRELEFLLKIEEVSKYVDLISKDNKYIGSRKSTMLTKTPNQVITSIGFDLLKDKLPIQVKVCSTVETALTFIGIPISDWDYIKSMINNVKMLNSI